MPRTPGLDPYLWAPDEWTLRAACRGIEHPDIFFSRRVQDVREALSLCRRCTVVEECQTEGAGQVGIWGGVLLRAAVATKGIQNERLR